MQMDGEMHELWTTAQVVNFSPLVQLPLPTYLDTIATPCDQSNGNTR